MGAALGPGAPGMMSGAPGMMSGAPGMMPGMSPTMPGMSPEMSGMSGMPGASGQAEAAPSLITWVYERANEGVTYVFGFSEEGRVSLVCVGDDKPYSICKGGRKPAFGGVKTSKGIKLGSSFKAVVAIYGYPESTEVIGDEVLMKYFERFGVAFTFKQNIMRVTSIAIKSPEE
ncbi:MAG TPA: hypothetical protein VHR86_02985, partial [Armatimonadota bacterium]|nr:hypothetical protein [Armatimonadota bacterium]